MGYGIVRFSSNRFLVYAAHRLDRIAFSPFYLDSARKKPPYLRDDLNSLLLLYLLLHRTPSSFLLV